MLREFLSLFDQFRIDVWNLKYLKVLEIYDFLFTLFCGHSWLNAKPCAKRALVMICCQRLREVCCFSFPNCCQQNFKSISKNKNCQEATEIWLSIPKNEDKDIYKTPTVLYLRPMPKLWVSRPKILTNAQSQKAPWEM